MMPLSEWEGRSPVVASMLNPALIATVVTAAAEEFERVGERRMPWELVFIVVPLVLHRDTRQALPSRTTSHLPNWIAKNPTLHAGFPERAQEMVPHVQEGLRFALREDAVTLNEDGLLTGAFPRKSRPAAIGDIAEIVRVAGFLGRWFSKVDRTSTVYSYFGVTP